MGKGGVVFYSLIFVLAIFFLFKGNSARELKIETHQTALGLHDSRVESAGLVSSYISSEKKGSDVVPTLDDDSDIAASSDPFEDEDDTNLELTDFYGDSHDDLKELSSGNQVTQDVLDAIMAQIERDYLSVNKDKNENIVTNNYTSRIYYSAAGLNLVPPKTDFANFIWK